MFVSSKSLLVKARKKHYALPAFNTSNLEVTQALFEAAQENKCPLIIQTTESAIRYAGLENLFSMITTMEKTAKVPVAIHLDHGRDIKLLKKCLAMGYKSVMIDASKYSFEKNVSITKSIVKIAHKKKASVEAEIGVLGRMGKAELTDPRQAKLFVEQTGCDALAVAIGTSHGAHKFEGKPNIDLQRLEEISELVKIPLVMHGSSSVPKKIVNKANIFGARIKQAKGVSEKQLKKAITLGVAKINIDTDLRLAFTASLREHLNKSPEHFDPRKYLASSREGVKEIVAEKMALFGCRGKAR
ncbi:MAG: tagatose-bisphosphate aldolase [Candidatus Diapherotrites archaeon]|uniref:Tagatose-bisphosphate aldolase n=1 Tax=Candidatus Iainarchaeum sp. TaxID=3101447 RepID=A0A2D6M1U0_9ARCH|nr:tagatose-bisphosphate aldolase [Candidatus Diapherotrites archaeon]